MDLADGDLFFRLEKEIAIMDPWRPDPRNAARFNRTIALRHGAAILPQQIVLTALSHLGEEKAKAQIFWPSQQVVARLEMGNAATAHTNVPGRPAGLPPVAPAPHAHLWEHNAAALIGASRSDKLPFAVPLPDTISGWEMCLRWFLARCNVLVPATLIFGLPPVQTLL